MRVDLCKENPYSLINVLGPFRPFCNHEIFINLSSLILLILMRQRENSQRYFDLSAFNWNLNHSNLLSTLGAMNCEKWEFMSGSPGRYGKITDFNKLNFCNKVSKIEFRQTQFDLFFIKIWPVERSVFFLTHPIHARRVS